MRYALLILFVIALSACNRSDIFFRFADDLAVSKTDDYFNLTSEQRDDLRKDVQKDIQNIKKELLPQVAKTLREIEPEVQKDKPNAELISRHFDEFQNYFKKVSAYFKNTAVKVSLKLKSDQYTHFAKELRDEIKETESSNELPEDSLNQTFKRYRRSIEFWIGGLSNDQKEKIKKFISTHPYPWRLQNQSKEFVLKQFLDSKENPEKLKKFVADFYDDFEAVRLPAYTTALNEHKKAFQKFLIEEFWQSLSKEQKTNLKENLLARAEELEKISQRP
ncbi:DUF6279 family lipoprotein [Bdellovibrio sp. HCB-162]|uniref:DUF6279 family lipoprotein n=1 Tax=Bdellovibrio sp. HCB-162 TaxID=3394234 RepID=UPI0039BC80AC